MLRLLLRANYIHPQACFDNNSADKCVHRLGLVPPWKSLLRFTRMKTLVPAKRVRDYQAEVFG